MNNLVSILIPCYNGEKFLERCFECLLLQDYKNIQIIFINDGSTDNSENIVKQYQSRFIKNGYIFKYIYQKNSGAASAINTGLKYVEGEYMMLYDVDDIIFPSAVSEKVKFLDDNNDYDMVRNNGYYVDNDDINNYKGFFVDNDDEKYNENIFEDLIYGKTNNWPSSFMVRTKSLFNHIDNKEIYISQFGQNLQIMLPVAYYGKSGFIDKPLMKYIRHDESHSACTNIEKKIRLINGYEKNRIEIIKQLDIDKKELDSYIRNIKLLYCRIRMNIASEIKDKELLIKEYNNLKKYKDLTINDRVIYNRGINSIFNYIYMSYISCRNIIRKMIRRKVRL